MLGAFAGKSLVEHAASDVGYGWVIAVFVVATVLTSGALLRAAGRIFLGRGVGAEAIEEEPEVSEFAGTPDYTPTVVMVAATILIVAGLALGALPGFVHHVQDAASRFTDRIALRRGRSRASAPTAATCRASCDRTGFRRARPAHCGWIDRDRRAPAPPDAALRPPRASVEPLSTALLRLRRLHSGQIGDYVAWAMLGFAALGGALALTI